jgi:DNA-binding transcriptional ArsR family regulator
MHRSLPRWAMRHGCRWWPSSRTGGPLDSQLKEGSKLTRQGITKHLRVSEAAGIVHSVHAGRESHFELDPEPLDEIKRYLDVVSEQWDLALAGLKSLVEE